MMETVSETGISKQKSPKTGSRPKRKIDEVQENEAHLGKIADKSEKSEVALLFPPASKKEKTVLVETRKLFVPQNRFTPLRENWVKIYTPIVEQLKLQVRFNVKTRNVEMRTSDETTDPNSLQKASDFIQAFLYGFDIEDALALVRLDDLYVETFDVKDVKASLQGDHLSRAIGRVAGKGGKTKFTIENATRTRIILADSRVHILGSFQNIQIARRAVCNLILGSPPSKVYGNLRSFAEKVRDRM